MILRNYLVIIIVAIMVGSGCQGPDVLKAVKQPFSALKSSVNVFDPKVEVARADPSPKSISDLLRNARATAVTGNNFRELMGSAITNDPTIVSGFRELDAKRSLIDISEAKKQFQLSSTIYGGIEDLSDRENGVALALDASKLMFDGGQSDLNISSAQLTAEATQYSLQARLDQKAFSLASVWVDLERYKALNQEILDRLIVLDPLIMQLEKVADAGIGDVTQVAAAQRTVSRIRVTQVEVAEKLDQARVNFMNSFGVMPTNISFDEEFITKSLPVEIEPHFIENAPKLRSDYAAYLSALSRLNAIKAKDNFTVGFQSRVTRPFGNSGRDSDESVGLVINRTLYDGDKLSAEISEAESRLKLSAANLEASFREGVRIVESARKTIDSTNKALSLAQENAAVAAAEIQYLRKQLVIGGSTLDSVLRAEANLYDAVSKQINLLAEKRKAELTIVSTLGLLASSLGLSVK